MDNRRRYRNNLTPQQMVDLQEELREMDQEEEEIERERIAYRKRLQARKKRAALRRKKQMQRIRIGAAAAAVLLVVLAGRGIASGASKKKAVENRQQQAEQAGVERVKKTAEEQAAAIAEKEQWNVSFSAVGDNLISQRLIDQAKSGSGYDFTKVYADTADFIKKHEINWIDVETTINTEIEPSGYPQFSTPGENGKALVDAGFNIFSLANNHTYDLGAEGISAAEKYWSSMQEQYKICTTGLASLNAGASGSADLTSGYEEQGLAPQTNVIVDEIPVYTCKNGKTVAFLTYVESTNPQSESDYAMYEKPEGSSKRVIYTYERDLIREQIKAADEKADAVVVSCHWGNEDTHTITDTQQSMAQFLADCGADLILGDHPHVIQNGAWISAQDGRQVFCIYSFGNFVSTQEDGDNIVGVALDCTLHFADGEDPEEPEVTIVDPKMVPVITEYGEEGTNAHVMLFSAFTEDMAKKHGIHGYISDPFTVKSIKKMLNDTISEEFRG
ncbi:MAG: CapA family protein [Eubacteriales bacterium]|nr:CapA family protein [Eubacteriales bacterium]